jgi:serine/threonine-protein kinase
MDAFRGASKAQLDYVPGALTYADHDRLEDWSSEVMRALEHADYMRAAAIAALEYGHSGDSNALLMQLNALFRAARWFDFEKTFLAKPGIARTSGVDGAAMRLLAIKVFLRLKKLDVAQDLLGIATENDESSLDHGLCEASLVGMQANYDHARSLLDNLNQRYPRNPEILKRLVQVCEQQRDYQSAAGFLRVALKVIPNDCHLAGKRRQYEALGAW